MENEYYKKILAMGFDVKKTEGQFRHLNYNLTKDGEKVKNGKDFIRVTFPDTNGKNSDPANVRPDSAGLYALRTLLQKAEDYVKNPPAPTPPPAKKRNKMRP